MTTPTTPELQPPYYYQRLDNGLEVLGQQMPSLGSVVFGVQFAAGAGNEPDENLGLCQLLEDMIFQGTPNRNARQITDAIELLGARRIVGTTYETMRFGAQVVHTRLEQALELWAELLLQPTFPRKEFEQLRPLLIQAIKRRDDEPMRRVGELITRTFYRESRLGRPMLGTVDSVTALTIDDLKRYYAERYTPDRTLFTIAGNFQWAEVLASVERLFGDWRGTSPTPYTDTPQPITVAAIQQEKGEQEHLYFGYPSVTFGDPDYYANALAVEILGGGMTSRLFAEVREKRGLVYQVSSYPQPTRNLGGIFVYAGTQPEKAHETAEVILRELRRLETDGVTQDELDRAKVQLKSELVMQSESSGSRAASLQRSWWYERRVIPTQEVRVAIDAVTTSQILQLQRRFPPTKTLTLVGVGPTAQDEITANVFPPR
jgi:predicted Zn-dependent peptidase